MLETKRVKMPSDIIHPAYWVADSCNKILQILISRNQGTVWVHSGADDEKNNLSFNEGFPSKVFDLIETSKKMLVRTVILMGLSNRIS